MQHLIADLETEFAEISASIQNHSFIIFLLVVAMPSLFSWKEHSIQKFNVAFLFQRILKLIWEANPGTVEGAF